jgi:ribosomal-protein-alanine N-acetyltransferase
MHFEIRGFVLRKPELGDIEALYKQKNDPDLASMLVGFNKGYARADLAGWVDFHRKHADEALFVVARRDTDQPVGHVGLYEIDHRIRKAEFAILLGDRSVWGRGLGRELTQFALRYGFLELNLNRISLDVLESNERAIRLYRALGFKDEGRLRQAQYKNGRYLDVVLMAMLREEWVADAG